MVSDYLTSGCTTANGVMSTALNVSCGIPQGSVLGPLFFLVYINDMSSLVNNVKLSVYADDTVLYVSGKYIVDCVREIQIGIDNFSLWCDCNALKINTGKTRVMVFGTSKRVKKAGQFKITANGKPLQRVPTYKYLGMALDSALSYKQHLATGQNCATQKIYSVKGKKVSHH